MNSLTKVSKLINDKLGEIPNINANTLNNSGTGYLYPKKFNDSIVFVNDENVRSGYIFQVVVKKSRQGRKHLGI